MTAEYEITKDDIDIRALAAIIAPRRAFADPTDFEELVRVDRGHDEKAAACLQIRV